MSVVGSTAAIIIVVALMAVERNALGAATLSDLLKSLALLDIVVANVELGQRPGSAITAPSDMESDVGRCHKAKSLPAFRLPHRERALAPHAACNSASSVGGAWLPRASGCGNAPAVAAFVGYCR